MKRVIKEYEGKKTVQFWFMAEIVSIIKDAEGKDLKMTYKNAKGEEKVNYAVNIKYNNVKGEVINESASIPAKSFEKGNMVVGKSFRTIATRNDKGNVFLTMSELDNLGLGSDASNFVTESSNFDI